MTDDEHSTFASSTAAGADFMNAAFGVKKREQEIDRLLNVPKNIEMLFTIGIELDEARQYLRNKSIGYGEFAQQFIGKTPKVSYLGLYSVQARSSSPASNCFV